jgi:Tol biopolymer transport system component
MANQTTESNYTFAYFTVRQLTAKSIEDPVRTGAISPDGQYLAFSDLHGLHIKPVNSGRVRTIRAPEEFANGRVNWQVMGWFPDGSRFIANLAPFDDTCLSCQRFSAWTISVADGSMHKLGDEINVESVSPDGSQISFTANLGVWGGREVWVMHSDGSHSKKLFESGEKAGLASSSGRRMESDLLIFALTT